MNEAKTTTQPQPPSGGGAAFEPESEPSLGGGGGFSLGGEALTGTSTDAIVSTGSSLSGPAILSFVSVGKYHWSRFTLPLCFTGCHFVVR